MKASNDKISTIYSILQLLLFCWLLTAQALGDYRLTDCLIYICILLDALFAVGTWLQRRSSVLPAIAMLLTLAADTLLVLLDIYYMTGVFLFCCVQVIYGIYIYRMYGIDESGTSSLKNRKTFAIARSGWLWMRAGIFAIFVCILAAFGQMDGLQLLAAFRQIDDLQLLAAFSFSQLLVNCLAASYAAIKCHGPERVYAQVFAAGLLLFLGCDLCVGIRNLPLSEGLRSLAFSLNWVFYIPSQYLIVKGGQPPLQKCSIM